ncbi:MAG: peptidoglycan-binding protein [Oscillatoriaceae cyanobacterium Prado104]|jgi:peptidoglycan hydrolase-like protein with peptidoglycan-binding domain|nr:peptidoglycan-binding protein [Oscillatoriaceae cyanobacterium Prado104]
MYTEEKTLNNQAMAIVADTASASNLAVVEASGIMKPTLKRGSTGSAVKELQQLLFHWGYYYGAIDGIFGPYVESAVKGYQHRVFLTEDGIVGSLTWQALYSGAPVNMPILMNGSSGNAVKTVQNVLKLNGYYFGFVDGYFGTLTKVAVIQFQTNQGLTADGIVGPRTWHALSKLPH